MNHQMLKSEIFGEGMLSRSDRFSKILINHIPVMITDNDRVVCIPDTKETTHIGYTAMTGKGKGIGGNTLLGLEYWMKKKMCLVLNDFQQETFEYSLPCLNKVFINAQKIIGLEPVPYPMVYVYPTNKDLIIGDVEKKFPHIKMSLPTRLVIREIEKYYKLDRSAKYVTGYIDKFSKCRDLDEIDEVLVEILEENFPDQKGKKFEEMKFKIKTIFKNIFDEEITDSASPSSPAFLTINKKGLRNYYNYTIQSLIAAGFIPSIQTSEIRGKPWFSAYMAFIVESIYQDKYKDEYLKNKDLCMYVPEIDKMWKGEKGELIKKALGLIGTNGRRAGIGLRWDAQDYDSVPDSIRANTKYLFVLRKANSQEVAGIKKDWNVDKEVQEQILGLDTDPSKGIFECVGLTASRFIIYNLVDGTHTSTNLPQKGRLIPPLAQHKVPGIPVSEVIKRL